MNSDLATTRCMPAMTNLRITKIQARQRGVALLLMLLVVLMIGGTFGVRALNLSTFSGGIENRETSKILAQSKEALLAWSQAVDPTSSGGHRAIRPGALPYPDVYGTGISVGPIAYDGMQDLGCIPRTWTVALSQNLVAPSTTPPIPTNLRCIGKLPWRLLGLDLNQDGTPDSAGFVPWYAVSANLIDHSYASECPARLDVSIAPLTTRTASCGTVTGAAQLPFPWLLVRDQFGTILSNRVAAVVIVPGPPATRQTGTLTQANRSSLNVGPDQFLDTVRNTLCTGGFCDNARYGTTPEATAPMEFIQCATAATTLGDSRFTQPYSCNDTLIYITIDELMQAASDRVGSEAINCLNAFGAAKGYAPFADSNNNRYADTDQWSGLLPTSKWDDLGPISDWLPFCPFFSNAHWDAWQQQVNYNVSALNTKGASGWSSPGDLPDRNGNSGKYKVTLTINTGTSVRWYGIQ